MDSRSNHFFVDVSGEEAESLLMSQGKDGSYLIRPSQSIKSDFSLSVRQKERIIHIKIQNTGDHYDLYGGEEFATLAQLVEYYKLEKVLKEKGGNIIRLQQPLPVSGFRSERWYHRRMTSSDAEEILKHQSLSSFLVRESQSKPGDFVLSVLCGPSGTQCHVTHVIINKENGKYHIGDGRTFNDLTKLIDYYRGHEITAKYTDTEIKFTLQKSVNLGNIKTSEIDVRVMELSKKFNGKQDKDRDGFWEEFEQLQHKQDNEAVYEKSRIEGSKPENKGKNRFKNILPNDDTRLVLTDKDSSVPGSDYINANCLNGAQLGIKGLKMKYIATQGCLKQTVADFWRMVWQEKSSIIVMTTKTVEMGKNKCYQYWPEEVGANEIHETHNGKITVKFVSNKDGGDFQVRVLEITRELFKKGKPDSVENLGTRSVCHYHFPEWPDKLAPKDSGPLLNFLNAINEKQKTILDSTIPMIVHCSAGIGRTGTFIVIDFLVKQILMYGLDCTIDVPNTLSKLREMRSGMVQTESQYKFIYLAVQQFVATLKSKSPPETNQAIYENLATNAEEKNKEGKCKASKKTIDQVYENFETVAPRIKKP